MPTDLTPSDLALVKEKIEEGLEDLSLKLQDEPRTHLGISEIGEACHRKLYYKFHWVDFEKHSGRILRLFKRGHREEERYVNYLEEMGCIVYRLADDGKQFRVSGVMGHYGGSCDGVVITPWFSNPFLLEMKTHNTKSFIHYLDKGLIKSKPKHYDQMCGYSQKMEIQYGIYFPENKNDDDIQVTVIKLDWQRGLELERKASEIIQAKEPPQKISENAAYYECVYCAFKEVCHEGKTPIKNCRSCRMSSAVEGAEWFCSRYNENIPKEVIKDGCNKWCPI
jgi:hypothetical protein